jgi:hypothetical protein
MSTTKNKLFKTKKVKAVFWLLSILFFMSLFVKNRTQGEIDHCMQHPYPHEVGATIDSLLEFLDSVDSTLNVLILKDDSTK